MQYHKFYAVKLKEGKITIFNENFSQGINAQIKPGTHICYSKLSAQIAKKNGIRLIFKQKKHTFSVHVVQQDPKLQSMIFQEW